MAFLKVDPIQVPRDICQTSLSILAEKIKDCVSSDAWIPDEELNYPARAQRIVNTVFLGGFLQRFFETGNWPDMEYRLWTCSSAVREVMIKLLGFREEEVGLLSRYDLFSSNLKKRNPYKINGADFIFAGRLSPSKNLEGLIWTLYYLQKNHNIDCRIHFYGESDDMISADRGRWDISEYGQQIKQLVKSLNWKKAPHFHGKVEPKQWLQNQFKNPVLVNFSTFMCEDFDVSLAQAQQSGWSSIVSNWGGHRDQAMPNCLLIPWKLIGRSDESAPVINIKSKILAQYITATEPYQPTFRPETKAPSLSVSKNRLDSLRSAVLYKLGPNAYRITKEGMAAYADTESGNKFFSLYRSYFGGVDWLSNFVITNDLNPNNRKIFESTMKIIEDQNIHVLLSSREVLQPENIPLLSEAERIYFAFEDQQIEKMRDIVRSITKEDCEIGSPQF